MKKFKKIIKLIFIAILIFLVSGIILTKCTNCGKKKESSIAYAAEENISLYSSNSINLNNQLNNNFYHFEGEEFGGGSLILSEIFITNLPSYNFTLEILLNSSLPYYFNLLIFNASGQRVDAIRMTQSDNLFYYSVIYDDSFYSMVLHCIYLDGLSTQKYDYNFNLYFYAGEYVPGYGQGLAAGLQQGKAEGAQIARYGIFQNSTVSGEFVYSANNSDATTHEFTKNVSGLIPDYISNGINTGSIYSNYQVTYLNGYQYSLYNVTLVINLSEPFSYSNSQPILINGPSTSLVSGIVFIDINNRRYYCEFVYNPTGSNYSKVDENIVSTMAPIKAMELYFGRAADTLDNVSIFQDNGNYIGGFTDGYNDGFNDGKLEGFSLGNKTGYDKGYAEGEGAGYSKAISEGVSQIGLFTAAVSFIKLFFQLVTTFLETKIAGEITLGLLVIGLPAAFMIVNLAIGLVKKFLGARGASEGND